MADLYSEVPKRALAIYAHPDDADVSCGGALTLWSRHGADVHLVICTQGDKGTADPDVDPSSLVRTRSREVEEASALLEVSELHQLDYADGELPEDRSLIGVVVGLVRRLKPDTVLCPDPTAFFFGEDYFNHRDHRVVGLSVLDAIAPSAGLPHYFPETGPPHQVDTALVSGTLEPSVWVDITETIDDKIAAVSCHKSQFAEGGEWASDAVRVRAQEEGRRAGVPFAEGFRRLRLRQ